MNAVLHIKSINPTYKNIFKIYKNIYIYKKYIYIKNIYKYKIAKISAAVLSGHRVTYVRL